MSSTRVRPGPRQSCLSDRRLGTLSGASPPEIWPDCHIRYPVVCTVPPTCQPSLTKRFWFVLSTDLYIIYTCTTYLHTSETSSSRPQTVIISAWTMANVDQGQYND
jgi:hypothetical protein